MPTPKKYGFGKDEKLKSRKKIAQLFEAKNAVFKYPIKCIYLFGSQESEVDLSVRMASICPKRNFKKAVDRNRLKRRIREAYRLNKSILFKAEPTFQLDMAMIFVGKQAHDYKEIEKAMVIILKDLYRLQLKS